MMQTKADFLRAIVVDDSPTVRDLLVAILGNARGIQVIGTASNGEEAVRLVKRLRPDVITMDILMPRMDGLEATRQIMRETPTPIVVVTGTLMRRDVDLTFDAIQAGALAVVHTPGLADPETCHEVVQIVRLMARVPVVRRMELNKTGYSPLAEKPVLPPLLGKKVQQSIKLIGIASSTGGPGTLATILRPLPADFPIPILIVQHITPGFGAGLAEWLNHELKLNVFLASHGEIPRPGTVLISPDDYHLQINPRGEVELHRNAPYRGIRPSANYLFSSLAQNYGASALGVILTGMGDDGVDGLEKLRQIGGLTLAQDEESCIVYGMPREAVLRNAVDQVLTPQEISRVFEHVARENAQANLKRIVTNG